MWTSYAQHARWCAVLARTDPDAKPHKGISYLLVDMQSPGIEVRPLVQSTGDPEFGEVYFDDVVVPRENLLGPLHGGWGIAMHTLTHERGWYGVGRQVILRVLLDRLVEEAHAATRDGRPAIESPDRAHGARPRAHRPRGAQAPGLPQRREGTRRTAHPGLESSVDKVVLARVEQKLVDVALDVLGAHAARRRRPPCRWQHAYFYGRAASVYGGAEQIQKNIIAERILGLPRSV